LPIFNKPTRVYFSPDKKLFESLYNLLGFYPKNIALYKLAFKHSSASSQGSIGNKESNERLEFLGDSIIGAITAEYLYKKFPLKEEGVLTKLRSRMVSREQHNKIALKLGLSKFIEVNNMRLSSVKPNSIYGDAYEALVGAIYIDKGYKTAKEFILNRIIHIHIDMDVVETKEVDFKSKIMEWAQKEKKNIVYKVAIDGAVSENKHYEIQLLIDNTLMGKAQHISKKKAEQLASEQAFLSLEI